jgi:pyruvate/2-oxoglutarate/acetoin dehydrogenase E1 component
VDLRTVSPLDKELLYDSVSKSGRMVVVDEDYQDFGLSRELAAIVLEAGILIKYRRVGTQGTIPYSRELEDKVLPNTKRIVDAVRELVEY